MNCIAMLDQMLEADLDVLDATGDSELARHLRHCERCRSLARQLTRDTLILARAVASTSVATRSGAGRVRYAPSARPLVAVAAGVAAVLSVFAVREWQRDPVPDDSTRLVGAAPATSATPVPPVDPSPPATTTRSANRGTVRPLRSERTTFAAGTSTVRRVPATAAVPAPVAKRTIVEPIGRPVAVAPVRLDTPSDVSLGTTVAVDPPAGTRANIIRTSNPAVTVVWLYH